MGLTESITANAKQLRKKVLSVSIKYVHLAYKYLQWRALLCFFLLLIIIFLHLNTTVTDFISKFMLY